MSEFATTRLMKPPTGNSNREHSDNGKENDTPDTNRPKFPLLNTQDGCQQAEIKMEKWVPVSKQFFENRPKNRSGGREL